MTMSGLDSLAQDKVVDNLDPSLILIVVNI